MLLIARMKNPGSHGYLGVSSACMSEKSESSKATRVRFLRIVSPGRARLGTDEYQYSSPGEGSSPGESSSPGKKHTAAGQVSHPGASKGHTLASCTHTASRRRNTVG